VPLMLFTSRSSVMGAFTNQARTTVAGISITTIVVALNSFLLVRTAISA
jgi:Mn2+/Fe2+ NRAMP family transporter